MGDSYITSCYGSIDIKASYNPSHLCNIKHSIQLCLIFHKDFYACPMLYFFTIFIYSFMQDWIFIG